MLHGNRTLLLVLTGTVVSSVFAAALTIIKYIAPTDSTLPEITYWLMGSFGKIGADDLPLLIAVITTCALILMLSMRRVQVRQLAGHSYRFLAKQPVLLENFLLLIRCLLSIGMLEKIGRAHV